MAESSEEQPKLSSPESPGSSPVAVNTNPSSPALSESGDPLLDSIPTDCLGLSSGYERLPRAKSHTTDDDDENRSVDADRRSPKPHHHGFFGRLFDPKPKKGADGDKTPKKTAEVEIIKPKKVDCAVQTEDDSDGGGSTKDEKKKKKKRSSWLPDPEKRWPIQGFS